MYSCVSLQRVLSSLEAGVRLCIRVGRWWCMPLAPRTLRQEDGCKFKASLSYRVRPVSSKNPSHAAHYSGASWCSVTDSLFRTHNLPFPQALLLFWGVLHVLLTFSLKGNFRAICFKVIDSMMLSAFVMLCYCHLCGPSSFITPKKCLVPREQSSPTSPNTNIFVSLGVTYSRHFM